jgi:sugar lactone lactonase YvrE
LDTARLYLGDGRENSITVYAPRSHKIVRKVSQGIEAPVWIAFDAGGNLYVANCGPTDCHSGTFITVYPRGSGNLSLTISAGINGPVDMVFDDSGNLYVSNEFGSTVTVYAPGKSKPLRTISSGVSQPRGLVFDRSGNLYVANRYPPSVSVYAPGGDTPIRTISTGLTEPVWVAFDRRGRLYVSNCSPYANSTVAIYSAEQDEPIGTISEGLLCAGKLVFSSNALYVDDFVANDVMVYALGGEHRLLGKISEGINQPVGMAFDSSGNLYVGNCGACGAVGRNEVTVYGPQDDRLIDKIRRGHHGVAGLAFGP